MINPDPWTEWKAGKRSEESNAWTDYQDKNPVQVSDLSDSGVDPLSAIAGGALATIIGKGIGAAIGAAFADGGLVSRPKTERQAKTVRQKLTATKEAIRLADGGSVIDQDSGDQALAALVVAVHARQLLSPEQAKDPEAIQLAIETLLQNTSEEEQRQWVADFLDQVDPEADGGSIAAILAQILGTEQPTSPPASQPEVSGNTALPDLTQIPKWREVAASQEYLSLPAEEQQQIKGGYFDDWLAPHAAQDGDVDQFRAEFMAQSDVPQDEKPGVHLASGGFLGGNLGIALGSAAGEWDRQKELDMAQSLTDLRLNLAKPELDTLGDQTAAKRSSYQLQNAQNSAESAMVGDKASNARLKLANDSASQETEAYGRLGQYKDDPSSAVAYVNKIGSSIPQFNGGTASGVTFDNKGANVTMSDGRSVLIPQSQIDRGAQSLNGKYDFMSKRLTGDIYRTNDKTGSIEPVVRADGNGSRPLSLAQDTSNKQIEISRQKIAGMTPDEIRRRTSKATDTGRENPDYDPMLAQHVRLANKRMYGADSWYDQQGQAIGQNQPAAQHDANTKFASDPAMRGNKMGNKTAKGVEVYDANGKLIGHYN